jgi:hypothetical protein
MHFSVMLIHENDEESIMLKRSFDATEADGADLEFCIDMYKAYAIEEYEGFLKENPKKKKEFPDLDSYMTETYPYYTKDEDGEYGSMQNYGSMYDWYCIGGRWSGILPTTKNNEELTALVKSQLDLTDKKIKEKYRDKVDEYVKISEMPILEACAYLKVGGTDSLVIGENDISAEDIINWLKIVTKHSNGGDALKSLIYSMIIEEDYDEELINKGDERICEAFFTEKFNYCLKKNKKEGTEFRITILDLHS